MQLSDIPGIRLANQQVTQTKFKKAEDLVSYLGAIQSQDFMGAKWALGLRMPGSTEAEIDKAFNEGKILRTHALRPTWHFVAPVDIRWIVKLNAPQVKRVMSYYNKRLGLNEKVFKKSQEIIIKSLKGNNFKTRQQLAKVLAEDGIKGNVQYLAHIMMEAELDAIICSGPKIGKQFSYGLINEIAPKSKEFSRDESLGKLAEIFFKSRGPATVKDFSKWSGLSIIDSRKGLDFVKSKFQSEIIDNKEYWFSNLIHPSFRGKSSISHTPASQANLKSVLLLPNYDEYVSSYADYSIFSTPETRKNLDKIGNALFWNHIFIDGMIAGSWKRTFKPKVVEIELALYRNLSKDENQALEKEIERFGLFFNLKTLLKYS